ncbi:hypothetical protein AcV7_004218 [Taiwanofungus camphoratus]|nr:hypothetical protein AcV7_004218 [Antrodia cinnamomea]
MRLLDTVLATCRASRLATASIPPPHPLDNVQQARDDVHPAQVLARLPRLALPLRARPPHQQRREPAVPCAVIVPARTPVSHSTAQHSTAQHGTPAHAERATHPRRSSPTCTAAPGRTPTRAHARAKIARDGFSTPSSSLSSTASRCGSTPRSASTPPVGNAGDVISSLAWHGSEYSRLAQADAPERAGDPGRGRGRGRGRGAGDPGAKIGFHLRRIREAGGRFWNAPSLRSPHICLGRACGSGGEPRPRSGRGRRQQASVSC